MSEKLADVLASLGANGTEGPRKRPLMTHVVLGYPSLNESIDLVHAMSEGGTTLIELQIPFSDPMADGPTIMAANEHALAEGVTPADCLRAAEKLAKSIPQPLIFMTYFNILFRYSGRSGKSSLAQFCKAASSAGVQGLIIPDVPIEEQVDGYWETAREHNLAPIPIVSPVSGAERLEKIGRATTEGFVYCVSTTGTTGAREALPPKLKSYLEEVRSHFDVPIALGFGISSPAQVATVTKHADIAVIGSRMIDLIKSTPRSRRLPAVKKFTAELAGLKWPRRYC